MTTITDYELFEVPPRWLFLRVETSDGLIGWGEPIVEGRARTVRTAVEELFETYLLGKDPASIERHWQTMYRGGFYRGGPVLMSAIAGVDQALWDLKGKRYELPVYELLGGRARDKIRIYQGTHGDTPEELAMAAEQHVENGLTAVKTGISGRMQRIDTKAAVEYQRERIAAIRETVGDEIDIGIDFHGRVSKPMTKRLAAALEPYDPMFIEEPVLAEHNDILSALAESTTVPIATGERMYSRTDFKPVLEAGAVDVIQPDLSHAGGITEVKKIAAMAEAYDVALAPHCPLGPIALASCIQVDINCSNSLIQEQGLGLNYDEGGEGLQYLSKDAFTFEDGFVAAPDEPGLGIEVDEAYVREQDQRVEWHNPIWHHEDGSVAEW